MVVAVRCPAPACRKYMLVEEADQGKVVPCLICKTPIRVPAADGTMPPPAARLIPPTPPAAPKPPEPPVLAPAEEVFLLPDPEPPTAQPFTLDPTPPASIPVAKILPPRPPSRP